MTVFQNSENIKQESGYPGGGLRDLFKHVGLGQDRKKIQNSKSEAFGSLIHLLACLEKN
jgi:hypothetical protein